MKLMLVSVAALSLVAVGCGRGAVGSSDPAHPANVTTPAAAHAALAGSRAPAKGDALAMASAAVARKPGDYAVFRFTGAFHKGNLVLTERVIAVEGATLVLEVTLTETSPKGAVAEETLRVKIDQKVGGRGEVYGVSRVQKGALVPAEVADWEALMAKTIVAADANEETLSTETVTVDVAGKSAAAQKTTYKVLVGTKAATMTVTQSDDFLWGDLGGEIVTTDGTLLYRAELVESGSAPPSHVAADAD